GLILDGMYSTTADPVVGGIKFSSDTFDLMNIQVLNCEIVNCGQHGILQGGQGFLIANCRSHRNGFGIGPDASDLFPPGAGPYYGYGMYYSGGHGIVHNCEFFENAKYGIHMYSQSGFGGIPPYSIVNEVYQNKIHDNGVMGSPNVLFA